MTVIRGTQAAVMTVGASAAPNSRVTQAAIFSVQAPPIANSLITQAAVFMVMANNRPVISLGEPIALECWNPCASYGTRATVFFIGAK
jgi:hypothetical protein